jgi:NAD+ kinase
MKVLLAGRHLETIEKAIVGLNDIDIVNSSPDLVITHGGDGSLLGAEREYPGVPKLPVRDTQLTPLCAKHSSFINLFEDYRNNKLKKTELIKLSGVTSRGEQLSGINDVFIHNVDRAGALRYRVLIGDQPYGHEIIGDGVGVATVHGSTAYYRSITHSIFKIGIGLAFSNSTEVTSHLVLPEDTAITVKITRGPAILVADNGPKSLELNEGDSVRIKKVEDCAVIYGLDRFMCPECKKLRHDGK